MVGYIIIMFLHYKRVTLKAWFVVATDHSSGLPGMVTVQVLKQLRILLDRFSLTDIARQVVGVGSVGTRCLIVLLEAGDGTPLFLQYKQAVPSVLEPYPGRAGSSRQDNVWWRASAAI